MYCQLSSAPASFQSCLCVRIPCTRLWRPRMPHARSVLCSAWCDLPVALAPVCCVLGVCAAGVLATGLDGSTRHELPLGLVGPLLAHTQRVCCSSVTHLQSQLVSQATHVAHSHTTTHSVLRSRTACHSTLRAHGAFGVPTLVGVLALDSRSGFSCSSRCICTELAGLTAPSGTIKWHHESCQVQ